MIYFCMRRAEGHCRVPIHGLSLLTLRNKVKCFSGELYLSTGSRVASLHNFVLIAFSFAPGDCDVERFGRGNRVCENGGLDQQSRIALVRGLQGPVALRSLKPIG